MAQLGPREKNHFTKRSAMQATRHSCMLVKHLSTLCEKPERKGATRPANSGVTKQSWQGTSYMNGAFPCPRSVI